MANNDTTTTLYPGTGGDSMNESAVPRPDGSAPKSPRTVQTDDVGNIYGELNGGQVQPLPTADNYQRAAVERAVLVNVSRLDVTLTLRHREVVRRGDRLDLIDHRGPGGR